MMSDAPTEIIKPQENPNYTHVMNDGINNDADTQNINRQDSCQETPIGNHTFLTKN